MKKIIVAICGIILSGGAYATVKPVSDGIKDAWNYSPTASETDVKGDYVIKTSDKDRFQYVDIVAAVEIYEHGAKFCRMKLQHNWNKWDVFIAPESCKTICKSDYYGEYCNDEKISRCEFDDLKKNFDKDAKPSPYKNKDIDGFYCCGYYSNFDTQTILLQIVSVDQHGVSVAPISFYGTDSPDYKEITYIKRRGEEIKLCAQGYELKGNKCTLMKACDDPLAGTDWCASWNSENFDEDYHETIKFDSCKQYRCKNSNEGFDSLSTKRCISCGETKKSGVLDNGVCKKCNTGQVFDKDKPDGCKEASSISREKLLNGIYNVGKCWMESSPLKYKDCVLDCGNSKHWNDSTKQCE